MQAPAQTIYERAPMRGGVGSVERRMGDGFVEEGTQRLPAVAAFKVHDEKVTRTVLEVIEDGSIMRLEHLPVPPLVANRRGRILAIGVLRQVVGPWTEVVADRLIP